MQQQPETSTPQSASTTYSQQLRDAIAEHCAKKNIRQLSLREFTTKPRQVFITRQMVCDGALEDAMTPCSQCACTCAQTPVKALRWEDVLRQFSESVRRLMDNPGVMVPVNEVFVIVHCERDVAANFVNFEATLYHKM
jgi:hypothetical protein